MHNNGDFLIKMKPAQRQKQAETSLKQAAWEVNVSVLICITDNFIQGPEPADT